MKASMRLLACAAAALVLAPGAASAEPLKFAHSTWVGYGPLYVAKEKGFFKQEGVDVELIVIEDTKVRVPALMAGKIDAMATTIDTPLPYYSDREQFRYIFAIDDSKGGDGIVAKNSIKTLRDLKGKKVAYSEGSVSQFYLATLLRGVGLKLSDLDSVNMSAGDAGGAFVAGRVDAAVTWEPWLTRGKQAPDGHLLIDSSSSPGLITDIAMTTPAKLKARHKDFQALARAWYRAVEFVKTHPQEADAIMARGVGGWLKKPEVFAKTRSGIAFYDKAMNEHFVGTAAHPGPMIHTIEAAEKLWTETGRMKQHVDPAHLIDFSIVNQ